MSGALNIAAQDCTAGEIGKLCFYCHEVFIFKEKVNIVRSLSCTQDTSRRGRRASEAWLARAASGRWAAEAGGRRRAGEFRFRFSLAETCRHTLTQQLTRECLSLRSGGMVTVEQKSSQKHEHDH